MKNTEEHFKFRLWNLIEEEFLYHETIRLLEYVFSLIRKINVNLKLCKFAGRFFGSFAYNFVNT